MTTINQGFSKLRSNLEITGLQTSTVSTLQNNARKVIEKEISVLDYLLIGSYIRNTMIVPLPEADINIFIVLDPKYYESNGQAPLLDKVKRVLKQTYAGTPELSRNGQGVIITFINFQVDVMPDFNRSGGGYLIPNSILKRWISTDPKKHIQICSKSNKIHNGDLIPIIIKMIKAWNKKRNKLIHSFLLKALNS